MTNADALRVNIGPWNLLIQWLFPNTYMPTLFLESVGISAFCQRSIWKTSTKTLALVVTVIKFFNRKISNMVSKIRTTKNSIKTP